MPLTSDLELKKKPAEAREPWTMRRLFPFLGTGNAIIKTFSSSELICAFMVVVAGIGELSGRSFPWIWYLLILFILCEAFVLRLLDKKYGGTSVKN